MSLRCRAIGLTIGVTALVWAFVGPSAMPRAGLTSTECWVGGLAGILCIVLSLLPWRCMKCRGRGTVPDATIDADLNLVLVTGTCDWCGGDGKGRL